MVSSPNKVGFDSLESAIEQPQNKVTDLKNVDTQQQTENAPLNSNSVNYANKRRLQTMNIVEEQKSPNHHYNSNHALVGGKNNSINNPPYINRT